MGRLSQFTLLLIVLAGSELVSPRETYLFIPASRAPVEWLFPKSEKLVRDKRIYLYLKPSNINNIPNNILRLEFLVKQRYSYHRLVHTIRVIRARKSYVDRLLW